MLSAVLFVPECGLAWMRDLRVAVDAVVLVRDVANKAADGMDIALRLQ
tara:strand:+ start:155 stop:298 length:144 start_codon:yes stop_codon:yes gene_type:complete